MIIKLNETCSNCAHWHKIGIRTGDCRASLKVAYNTNKLKQGRELTLLAYKTYKQYTCKDYKKEKE